MGFDDGWLHSPYMYNRNVDRLTIKRLERQNTIDNQSFKLDTFIQMYPISVGRWSSRGYDGHGINTMIFDNL